VLHPDLGCARFARRSNVKDLAYLDAASGSMIVQAIVAGAAGAAVFFKLGWRRISAPFRGRQSDKA
jgi:hypothetical protein